MYVMNGENKILKIIFIVLLIAVIGEVVYFFSLPKNEPVVENTVNQPTPTRPLAGPSFKDLPPAFDFLTLDQLSTIPLYPNTKAVVYLESKNKAAEVRTEAIVTGTEESPYGVKLDYGSGIERWVHFSKNDMTKIKITYDESGGGIKVPANISDIKKGDTIFLKYTLDPFYNPKDPRQIVEIELNIIR